MITVLSVSYSLARVAPDAAGGAEVVLSQIDRALVASGRRSIVVAPAGSEVAGTLVPTPAPPEREIDGTARWRALEAARAAIARAHREHAIDVVHFHGPDLGALVDAARAPILATLHLPIADYPRDLLDSPAIAIACVSATQASTLPAPIRARARLLPNGVDLARYRARARKHGYVLALGRVCPEKNFADAILAAELARAPLVLGGVVHPYPDHRRYFEERIVPRLGRGVRFAGPVSGARKRALIAGARCLLVPSTVAETSSLVAMEALACGTPVIAYPSGALPEIVEDGRTGLLARDPLEMARAIARVGAIDPRDCREAAERRFDGARAAARTIALLEEIARARGASDAA